MQYSEKKLQVTSVWPGKVQSVRWWLWPSSWKKPQLPLVESWARSTIAGSLGLMKHMNG